ncbi:MAG: hemerythrin family protein [Rhodocyclales bacterium]|nr:hemerythrin family protein [Rhodocyclales bacterium]
MGWMDLAGDMGLKSPPTPKDIGLKVERRSHPRREHAGFGVTIGVKSIDREHAALFDQLDRLQGNPGVHPGSEAFTELLSRLGRQIDAHFKSEEEILRTCGMPEEVVREHFQAHTAILDEYARLNLDMMDGGELSREDALRLIRNWIVQHVLSHDVKIVDFVTAPTDV